MKKYIFSILFLSVNFLVPFQLSARPSQQQDHQKNYNSCLHGYSGCDSSSLTDAERTQVQQAARQRNYSACLHGYSGCDSSQLTEGEQTLVQQAAHQRNYSACLHGYSGCNSVQLTATEREAVSAGKRNGAVDSATPGQDATPSQDATPPRYYTNSAGERVQSPTYSKTVPAGATAQCRDGTYSFSRNHRGTCSHHGGVSKWLD
jgi:hypothetical protein